MQNPMPSLQSLVRPNAEPSSPSLFAQFPPIHASQYHVPPPPEPCGHIGRVDGPAETLRARLIRPPHVWTYVLDTSIALARSMHTLPHETRRPGPCVSRRTAMGRARTFIVQCSALFHAIPGPVGTSLSLDAHLLHKVHGTCASRIVRVSLGAPLAKQQLEPGSR
jgi:hypothetical protein